MTIPRRRFLKSAAAALTLPALPHMARAQAYPSRPVRIIVATAAGGTTDLAARLIAQWLSDKLSQPFTVENRTGGSNNIGTEAAARAAPDGTTLFMANSVNAINTSLFPNLTFNFSTDLLPVAIAMKSVLVLQVHPSVPVKTLPEFIAYAKANPGKINMGSGGKGSTGAMCGELFQLMAGVKFQHVPYRGSAPALQDLIGGTVDVMFDNLGVSLSLVKSGNLKLLAVATPKRMASLPDVPTIAETLGGFDSAAWYAVVAPPKTPAAIVNKINADINEALRDPALLARLPDFSAEPIGGTPSETAAYMREEVARWKKVIESAGVKLE